MLKLTTQGAFRVTILVVMHLLLLVATGICLANGFEPVETIDKRKLEEVRSADEIWRKSTSYIDNVFWPTSETIKAKRYIGNLDAEIAELMRMLRRIMREEYLPLEEVVRRDVIGLTELRGGNDYLRPGRCMQAPLGSRDIRLEHYLVSAKVSGYRRQQTSAAADSRLCQG